LEDEAVVTTSSYRYMIYITPI